MDISATARPAVTASFAPSATTWLKLSVVYLMLGVGLGIAMGVTEDFTLKPVHAHLNLLGFATVALAGLIYTAYPEAARSRLARIHFWLHNGALPVMMGSLAWFLMGHPGIVPLLGASEVVAAAGVIAFASNVFLNVKPLAAQAALRGSKA
jgi:hypothetical protein